MIPLRLKISGFLSYRDPVEVDFSTFELACISGQNGAGKSSLLDAITWVLFGQARKRDEALINTACDSAGVEYIFEYEQNVYRIKRIMPRGKTTMLEFQIQNGDQWRVLTEATFRATQARIEATLRMDYETFVNASFFLQGKADQFTQQKPGDRKRILSSILGLEIWDTYLEHTKERRKALESELDGLQGRLAEINAELAEESARLASLKELETSLAAQVQARKAREQVIASARQVLDSLRRQEQQVENLSGLVAHENRELEDLLTRQAQRIGDREQLSAAVSHGPAIEAAYQAWRSSQVELEQLNALAENFREQEKLRQAPLAKIGAEQARLEQERDNLFRRQTDTSVRAEQIKTLELELARVQQALSGLETRLKQRARLEESQAIITRFHEQARLRQAPLTEISTESARLEQELKTLEKQAESIKTQRTALERLALELGEAQTLVTQTESHLNQRKELEARIQEKRDSLLVLRNTNERLSVEMDALIERIKELEVAEGALCPLCGQPLSPKDRENLVKSLKAEGKEKGDAHRSNKADFTSITAEISKLESELSGFARVEQAYKYNVSNLASISERVQTNKQAVADWDSGSAARLEHLQDILKKGSFSQSARQNLARIDRELSAIGKALGVRPAGDKSIFDGVEDKVTEIEAEINSLKGLDEERMQLSTRATTLKEQINNLQASLDDWDLEGRPRLEALLETLASANFAPEERRQLAEMDARLKSLGYDPAAHESARQTELAGRSSEKDLRDLESARAALVPLERELADIRTQVQTRETRLDQLKSEYETEKNNLASLQASAPDLRESENALMSAQELENVMIRNVGAAQQKVRVLEEQRRRKTSIEAQREDLAIQIKNHKTLERAFGKDGVPALLIEQALPQIEEKANELLDRLSNGSMSVRFVTQAGYKAKNRDDLKETLDIQISDGAGARDYEMFSGGEAFRVNFAIRLALSEILARRTGARLQTLVIDEGFGSQDAQGRQRLIEAINQVKPDFEKILIITHLEELKEAFPNRIEVEKTQRGSTVTVI